MKSKLFQEERTQNDTEQDWEVEANDLKRKEQMEAEE